MINIIVVEDNETIRKGLKMLINETDNYNCIADYAKCELMIKNLSKLNPDVLLIDIGLPGMNGIEGIIHAKKIIA